MITLTNDQQADKTKKNRAAKQRSDHAASRSVWSTLACA